MASSDRMDEMSPDNTFEMTIPKAAAAIRGARRQFGEYLERCGFDLYVQADIAVALGEALANALEHGYRRDGRIVLRAEASASGIEIEVPRWPGLYAGTPAVAPAGGRGAARLRDFFDVSADGRRAVQ